MDVKDREKSLIKNTGILALGTLCSKIFSFFLLPLYTAVLTTEDYGTVDVLQTVSSFAMPFITLQLCSAVFRFIIEKNKKEDQVIIITTGVLIEALNVGVFTLVVYIINSFYHIEYCSLFILYFASMALLELCQNITRGFGNNKLYSLMSFVMTCVSLISNIIMILGMGMRGDSILIASSMAYLTASGIAVKKQKLWKFFHINSFKLNALKEMLRYCLPLLPNAVSWWVTNASDRLLIQFFLGVGSNGIYAAANKIPTIYTTIFNVYNIAWVEALSRNFGDKKQEEFINSMFKKSLELFGCICLGIICSMSIFFDTLIAYNYRDAYIHVYILLVAIFFNSVCSLLGGIFTAFKRSGIIGTTTVIGAIVNFLMNLFTIRSIGLYASSVSTLISYIVIVLVRNYKVKKLISLKWPKGYLLQLVVMLSITSFGYFMRILILNIIILIILFAWSYYANRELLNGILASVSGKAQGIYEKVNRYILMVIEKLKRIKKRLVDLRKSLMKIWSYFFLLIPVKTGKIVFINFNGKGFGCNPKYIALELLAEEYPYDLVWLLKKTDNTLPPRIRWVLFDSVKALYELATASVIITNTKSDVRFVKRKGQYVIQTWHASYSPKYLEEAASNTLSKKYINESKHNSKQTDLFISNSKLQSNEYRESFWCECEILECGLPRNDIFFDDSDALEGIIRGQLHIPVGKRVILYTPTFRDNKSMDCYTLDTKRLLDTLKTCTNDDWILLVRMHPNIGKYKNLFIFSECVIDVTQYPDIQELLLVSDILITDYSTTMFDVSIVDKPVFLYASDIKEYQEVRGLKPMYFTLPFTICQSNDELIEAIKRFDEKKYTEKVEQFMNIYENYDKGMASKAVVHKIFGFIGENKC